jgi:hypothetical protein
VSYAVFGSFSSFAEEISSSVEEQMPQQTIAIVLKDLQTCRNFLHLCTKYFLPF